MRKNTGFPEKLSFFAKKSWRDSHFLQKIIGKIFPICRGKKIFTIFATDL
jgi:hypothetical protein